MKPPEALDALVGPILEGDPALREKAGTLISTALDRALGLLQYGDRGEQMAMIKALLPAVFRASANNADTQAASLKRDFEDFRAEFRSTLFTKPEPDGPAVTEDNVTQFRKIQRAGSHHRP